MDPQAMYKDVQKHASAGKHELRDESMGMAIRNVWQCGRLRSERMYKDVQKHAFAGESTMPALQL